MRGAVLVTLASLALASTGPAPAQRVVVAWDRTEGGGSIAALDAAPPFAWQTPVLALGADGVVHTAFGRVYHLSRASGVLSVIDPATWSVTDSFALDPADEPRDVLVLDPQTAWVTRAKQPALRVVDLDSGASTEGVDLTALADADGNPDAERMLRFEDRVYVQVRRMSDTSPPFEPPAGIAVIDLASGTLVDADPVLPGVQAIALAGTSPRFAMQVAPATRELWVSATGFWMDGGGIERIDLDALASLGLVVDEGSGTAGADVGAFALTGPETGWTLFSTDLLLSSHLHAFSIERGLDPVEEHVSLHYFVPSLIVEPLGQRLFWPEPDALRVFHAASGDGLGSAPLPSAGNPTDLALLPATPGVPWGPGGLGLSLAALAAALALRARARLRSGV